MKEKIKRYIEGILMISGVLFWIITLILLIPSGGLDFLIFGMIYFYYALPLAFNLLIMVFLMIFIIYIIHKIKKLRIKNDE